jgi:site-specific DNA-methyltransferase (adenine-specific)
MLNEEGKHSLNIDSVYHCDCIEGMKKIPENSIDLIIADPPYNVSKGGSWSWDGSTQLPGFGGEWKKMMENWDNMTFDDYWGFTIMWLKEAKRVLKGSGSIWVCGTYHNIGIINTIFQILNIEIINEIIWYKRNAFPNLSGRRFTASHENILWGHVGNKKRRYLFNYEHIKNKGFVNDNLNKPGKQIRTVWDIPNNKTRNELAYGKHPSQKPLSLINRMIISTTNSADTILVPFVGAGTECVAAKMLKRHFIGFEIEEKYVRLANKRLDNISDSVQYDLKGEIVV